MSDFDAFSPSDPGAKPRGLNPYPFLLTLLRAMKDEPAPFETRVVHAGIHAWMEGHVGAPGHPQLFVSDAAMPAPPFPSPNNTEFARIIDETLERFEPIHILSATAYVAALAWAAGEREGERCRGCALPTREDDWMPAIRRGAVAFKLVRTDG